jgi:hypothetical protein
MLDLNMNMKNTAHSTISALRRALFVSAALVGLSLGACDKDKSLGDEYKPCEGKSCGDPCQVCAPDDKDCLETQELKACDPNGQCVSDSEALMCEGGYEPCAGKSCGESCSICAPEDQDCVESAGREGLRRDGPVRERGRRSDVRGGVPRGRHEDDRLQHLRLRRRDVGVHADRLR